MALLWLLLRVRWRRALAPSLAVALLIGGIGGFVLASAAAARRVDNAYRTFSAEIDAPDVAIIPVEDCGPSTGAGCEAPSVGSVPEEVLATVRGLDVVEKARLVESIIPFITDAAGTPILGTVDDVNGCFDGDRSVHMVATQTGGPTAQVVPFSLEGELPNAGSGTVVLTRSTAQDIGLNIGDEVLLAGWCGDNGDPHEFDEPIVLRVSGLSIGPLDVEAPATGLTIHAAFVDPKAFEAMVDDGAQPQQNVVTWLDPAASPERVEEALEPFTVIIDFRERQAVFDDALKTDANLLWLLAAVGALGGLLVLAPVVGRNLRDTGPNSETLAALGTQRRQITHQALAHGCSLAAIGALTAAVVAVPISAYMPNGLASELEPHREFWFDFAMTISAAVLLIALVVAMAAIPSWRIGRVARLPTTVELASSRGMLGSFGLRPAARTGVSAAIGAPAGPRRSSPWPSLISMAIAGVVGVASLTYLSGLRHLEQSPPLMGWNWDAVVSFDFFEESDATGRIEIIGAIEQLEEVEVVTAGTLYPPWFLFAPETGATVWPWSFATGPNAVTPAMLSGRAPQGPDEVAIDEQFAEETGLGIGDSISLARVTLITLLNDELTQEAEVFGLDLQLDVPEQTPVVAEFEITGIALLPIDSGQEFSEVALTLDGFADLVKPSAAEVAAARAWLPTDLLPILMAEAEAVFANLDIEDRVVYVRFEGDVFAGATAIAGMDMLASEAGERPQFDIVAPTPEQVMTLMVGLNIERNDRVPIALAIMVAFACFAVATYLLIFSIRSRRFEIAVMRSLGLSAGGVRWSVAAQATATAVVALLIATPLGVLVGRWAWLQYADGLPVLPVATIPWAGLALVAVAAVVLANAVALVPAWLTVRRSPGYDLRSE